jgi:hypothetical protein
MESTGFYEIRTHIWQGLMYVQCLGIACDRRSRSLTLQTLFLHNLINIDSQSIVHNHTAVAAAKDFPSSPNNCVLATSVILLASKANTNT